MIRRRILATLANNAPKLPNGYQQIEYIENGGNGYIDTGVKATYQTRVVLDISDLTSVDTHIFGAKKADIGTASDQFSMIRRTSTTIRSDYFGTNASADMADTITRFTVDKDANVTKINGVVAITNTAVSSGASQYNMYLFGCNTANDSSKIYPSSYKLYSCKIYDNGVLVRDFIPCTNPDGISGLWDSVNDVFYKMLPADYTRLDFIETDGTTYIDTGFSAKGGFRAQLTVSQLSATPEAYIIGAHGTGIPYARNGIGISSDKYMIGMCGYELLAPAQYNTPLEIECSTIIPNAYLKVNGETLGTFSSYINADATNGTELTSNNILIFSSQWHVVNAQPPQGIKAKLWKCKIYSADGTLVRDFIPAMNASGEAGLYDLKNGVWYALKPVVKPKVENKIRVRQGDFRDLMGREGIEYGFSAQYSLASDVTIYYKGDDFTNGVQFSSSFIMKKGQSSVFKVKTNVFSAGIGIVGAGITAITSISPTEDDTYIYTF